MAYAKEIPHEIKEMMREEIMEFFRWWTSMLLDSMYKCRIDEIRWFVIGNPKHTFRMPWEIS